MTGIQKIRGFLPYLLIVFINAFVDLGHKIVVQNTVFKAYDDSTLVILTAIVNALILLPFLLLFSTSGFLSDRFSKTKVMKYSAALAIVITLLITACYYMGWFWAAFSLTLVLAMQSAIYSPAKYGYIRELVGDDNLARGNAAVQAITIIAILCGTFVFSILFENLFNNAVAPDSILKNIAVIGWILVALSVIEFLLTFTLPATRQDDKTKTLNASELMTGQLLRKNIKLIRGHEVIWLSIIGLAVFWAVSQVVLATFPAMAKADLNITNTIVIQGLLAATGIGIVIGAIIAGRISRNFIETGLIPLGAFGVAMGIVFIPMVENTTILAVLFTAIGLCGSLLIVPLNSLIQYYADEDKLGTIIAGNNWVQNVAMLVFLLATAGLAYIGVGEKSLIYGLAVIAFAGFIYTLIKLPVAFARIILSVILKRKYRTLVHGFDNIPHEGGVLLMGNHISWIDWLIIQVACPRQVRFVMLRSIYEKRFLKSIFKFFKIIPISSGNSEASLIAIKECIQNGEVVCLFPEGMLSRNGQLGSFRQGYEKAVAELDEGVIVPFYLHGLWGSRLSRSDSELLREERKHGAKGEVMIAFGKPLPISTKSDVLKQEIFELSIDTWNAQTNQQDPIPLAWLRTAKRHLFKTSVIDSALGKFSNLKMIMTALLFAKIIKKQDASQNIGILLPASAPGLLVNMAVMLLGRTAVNLNFTTSVKAVQSGIRNAEIVTVISSNKFIKKLTQKGIEAEQMIAGTDVLALEDVRSQIKKLDVIKALLTALFLPAGMIYKYCGKPVSINETAQILFSSGSEGEPKGILLSHANFMSNIKQVASLLNMQKEERILSSLPIFHSFGLTITSFMPLIENITAVCHADPKDVLGQAKLISQHKVSIMCGTATFLRLYVRNTRVNAEMLSSLRLVVAGAEKLPDEVRDAFILKFKKTIYEGYGATETTPVACVNVEDKLLPDTYKLQVGNKPGTVGLPIPGTSVRIVDPDTMESLPTGEDGLVLISGGQVMKGYLNNEEKTKEVLVELDGRYWYKTGDKGHLDSDGFLTLVDRYSRFAKIGGEMVSLSSVEQAILKVLGQTFPDEEIFIAATAVKDAKKGEKIVLLLEENSALESVNLRTVLVENKLHALMLPADILSVEKIPVLGSGKLDFVSIKKKAEELLAENQ